jgi:hypothetical protein
MTESLAPASRRLNQRTIASVVAVAIVYDIVVLGLQLTKWFGAPPAVATIGEYSGAVAVALCVIAAILVCKMTRDRRLRIIALAAAAVFAALTVDDVFSIHDRMNNDDYLALTLWLIAGSVLLVLLRLEKPGRAATAAICAGFFLHGLAALADGADGGIFTLDMISPFELGLSKEILELAYMGLYLVGVSQMLPGRRSRGDGAGVIAGTSASAGSAGRLPAAVADDRELLELESWYWAWRSHTQANDDQRGRSADELLTVTGKLAALPSRSIMGVAAKLRVFQDMIGSAGHASHPETDARARLLAGIVTDADHLANTGI